MGRREGANVTNSWLTGGRRSSGAASVGPLPASPPGTTEAGMNKVSDVGRELGGVGMYTGTGFRQPIPREFEGAMIVAISKLILSQLGS
jgi:hypothetical protein